MDYGLIVVLCFRSGRHCLHVWAGSVIMVCLFGSPGKEVSLIEYAKDDLVSGIVDVGGILRM